MNYKKYIEIAVVAIVVMYALKTYLPDLAESLNLSPKTTPPVVE